MRRCAMDVDAARGDGGGGGGGAAAAAAASAAASCRKGGTHFRRVINGNEKGASLYITSLITKVSSLVFAEPNEVTTKSAEVLVTVV
jgi:hypothetical protein